MKSRKPRRPRPFKPSRNLEARMPAALQSSPLKDLVQSFSYERSWVCLSPVTNGLGLWTILHWKCWEGHSFHASLHSARLLPECPVCRRNLFLNRKPDPKPKPAAWQALPIPEVIPVSLTPETPGNLPEKELPLPKKAPGIRKRRKRSVLRSGVIG